jgi:hypothetical protein
MAGVSPHREESPFRNLYATVFRQNPLEFMPNSFNPNELTFDQGVELIKAANQRAGYDWKAKITTSRDPEAKRAENDLIVTNVPEGFKKWQLPVYLDKPSQLYVSVGAPDADVPLHSHDEGDGIRYIVNGSIIYEGKELHAGDWMFIPAGKQYSIKMGLRGATMFYCYCCSCARPR